jgi:hypothetical protein
MYYILDSLADFGFFLLLQVAWQPWTQNITWRRLDPRRVKVIDSLWEIKAAQLEPVFSLEGQRLTQVIHGILVRYC